MPNGALHSLSRERRKDSDPSATFSIEPGETRYFADVVAAVGTTGLGSLDLLSLSDARPVAVTRIYNDAGARGTTGMTFEPLTDGEAVRNGDSAILIAPASPADFRYNLGVRTLSESTTLQFLLRDASGTTKKSVEVSYGPDFFTQIRASDLLGIDVGASDTLAITVKSGAAFLYGATTDNRTQDPSVQLAEKR